jgi:hypothetical protein
LFALAGGLSAASCNAQQSAYEYAIMADNPVAYWSLNESSGAIIHDVIGGHNGTSLKGVNGNAGVFLNFVTNNGSAFGMGQPGVLPGEKAIYSRTQTRVRSRFPTQRRWMARRSLGF